MNRLLKAMLNIIKTIKWHWRIVKFAERIWDNKIPSLIMSVILYYLMKFLWQILITDKGILWLILTLIFVLAIVLLMIAWRTFLGLLIDWQKTLKKIGGDT